MAKKTKFEVGGLVMVVTPDSAYDAVQDKILTLIEWYDDGDHIVWHVDYDGKPADEDFACWDEDLAAANVKVFEGLAVHMEIGGEDFYVINEIAVSADTSLFKSGDTVRVTVEVIRKGC